MSFGEFVNVGGFIQKRSKVDAIVRSNHVHLRDNQYGKTLEASRRSLTEDGRVWPQPGGGRSPRAAGPPAELLALPFDVDSPTAFEVQSTLVL
jgi:hypothetical protein